MPFSAVFTLKAFVNGSVNISHALIKRGKEGKRKGGRGKSVEKGQHCKGKGEMESRQKGNEKNAAANK